MNEGNTLARRLRALRKDRKLSQKTLAEKAGLSTDLISKLERGVKFDPWLSTVMKLSYALDCDIGELTGRVNRLGPDRNGGSVLQLRDALLSPTLLAGVHIEPDEEPVELGELNDAASEAWGLYWNGKFGKLLEELPPLIGKTRVARSAYGAAATEPLATTYDLAGGLLTQIGRTDLGALACERAITAAHDGDDELLWASMHAGYSWVLLHQGRHAEAEQVATEMADQLNPRFDDDDLRVGVWGHLLMTALAPRVAAKKGPKDLLKRAGAGAERLGRRVPVYRTSFGPASVAMQATYAWSQLHKPSDALKAAKAIEEEGDLQGISYGAHLMDVAAARVQAQHWKSAERSLLDARKISPVWFRHQRVARTAVLTIRENARRVTPGIQSLAKTLELD